MLAVTAGNDVKKKVLIILYSTVWWDRTMQKLIKKSVVLMVYQSCRTTKSCHVSVALSWTQHFYCCCVICCCYVVWITDRRSAGDSPSWRQTDCCWCWLSEASPASWCLPSGSTAMLNPDRETDRHKNRHWESIKTVARYNAGQIQVNSSYILSITVLVDSRQSQALNVIVNFYCHICMKHSYFFWQVAGSEKCSLITVKENWNN